MKNLCDNNDLGIILSMLYVSWADGSIKKAELELIKQEIDDQGLGERERAIVKEALFQKPTVEQINSYLDTSESKESALTAAYIVAFVDGNLDIKEINAIEDLVRTFKISQEKAKEIQNFALDRLKNANAGEWESALLLENFL